MFILQFGAPEFDGPVERGRQKQVGKINLGAGRKEGGREGRKGEREKEREKKKEGERGGSGRGREEREREERKKGGVGEKINKRDSN